MANLKVIGVSPELGKINVGQTPVRPTASSLSRPWSKDN